MALIDDYNRSEDRNAKSLTGPSVLKQAVARERSAIATALGHLDGELALAHDFMSQLENRLQPATTPVPRDEMAADRERAGSSEVYHNIHNSVDSVYVLQRRIQHLLTFLEV